MKFLRDNKKAAVVFILIVIGILFFLGYTITDRKEIEPLIPKTEFQ